MTRIQKLPPQEAQKIAAGEVVDRPANAVKELIENAIDAQANQISLYIEDGGKKLIRVVDNGCGMSAQDAHLCFEHHATSKITTVGDLDSIATFGFRGEALSSINAVSKVALKSREAEAQEGIALEFEQASLKQEQTISCNPGTDIAVHDLFYNVPARKKFLKTSETEWRHIVQLFYAFCLSYRSIHFVLYSEGKQIHNCPPVKETVDRVAQLWGHHLVPHMLECAPALAKDFSINGAVSNHTYSRFDRSMIFLFVNNRWIKNIHLSRALLRGYSNILQPSQYPAAFMFITIESNQVDINIHPRKEEIKFLHPRTVEISLQESVKKTLNDALTKQLNKTHVEPTAQNFSAVNQQPRNSYDFNQEAAKPITFDFKKPVFAETAEHNYDSPADNIPIPAKDPVIPNVMNRVIADTSRSYTIIGQLKRTYILLEQEDGLFMVDQHAAHERILYEQFAHRFEDIATTKLLFPQIIKLNSDDMTLISNHLSLFKKNGIEIEPFGNDQLIIHATPVNLKSVPLDDLIKETIGWIIEYKDLEDEELHKKLNEKMHAKMACSAAVKAGDLLSMQQMQQLMSDLEKTENNLTCPHGRPTGYLFAEDDIKKKFKRDYRSPQKNSALD